MIGDWELSIQGITVYYRLSHNDGPCVLCLSQSSCYFSCVLLGPTPCSASRRGHLLWCSAGSCAYSVQRLYTVGWTPFECTHVSDTPGVYLHVAFLDRSVSFSLSVIGGDPYITERCGSIRMADVDPPDVGCFVSQSN